MNYEQTIILNNGVEVPRIALGTWMIPDGEPVVNAIHYAVEAGYRSIDTAMAYKNEAGVGEGIRTFGVNREELYVTTKLFNPDQGFDSTLRAYETSLNKLDIGYIDQYLIHWPCPAYSRYVDTYLALEKLYNEKLVRTIGVCNFNIEHLEELRKKCHITPAVNQIEMHPMLIQPELLEYCKTNGIQIEAYSPLMHGGEVLHNELIIKLAEKYGKSVGQVVLRYILQYGVKIIVKSVHRDRIVENHQIFDFEITEEDWNKIGQLNRRQRTCGDPATMNFM